MNELSLYILDIMMNSVKADCKRIDLIINESDESFIIKINDDGIGMNNDKINEIINKKLPSKNHGRGLFLYKSLCLENGGDFFVESSPNRGTSVFASFKKSDTLPVMGNLIDSVISIMTCNVDLFFEYQNEIKGRLIRFNTKEIKEILDGFSLQDPQVMKWVKEYMTNKLQY